ncbi:MAG: tetratricopeptide repeat protein, partial [Pseudomonadota bacterium]|nr:tetratricopeptide repeat protein [Pseudomonadota bacterium]
MVDIAQALDAHQNNKHAEAERLYHELLAADPNNPNILHLMAISYGQRGLLSKAEEYVLKAIQLNPDSSSFYNSYANIKKYQHDITAAIDLYKKSIIINSINPAAYYNLGIIYLQRQDYKISEEFLYLAIKQKEDYEEAYIMLIQCLHESAQYKKASELLNKAKKLDFQSSKFILFYAQNLQFQNNLTKAKSMLLKYVDISPDDYQGHHHLATT